MEPTGTGDRPRAASRVARLLRTPAARLAVPLFAVGALLIIDEAAGPKIALGDLLVAAPALSAVFLTPLSVLIVAVVTVVCVVLAEQENQQLHSANFPIVMVTVALVSAASVAASAIRDRREHQLAQARWVAAVTQRVLLKPLPGRLGRLSVASMYLAADEESAIGGDLYAAVPTDDGGARVLIGDVQGKGLGAVEVAGFLLTAFRRAVRRAVPLPDLPGYLDRHLREDMADLAAAAQPRFDPDGPAAPRAGPGVLEGFITAVVADVSGDGDRLTVVNCGHPPPLLIRGDKVLTLHPAVPALPLGLGDLGPAVQPVDSYDLDPGDILLLYTDGVIETRDVDGTFYPLTERLAGHPPTDPDDLLRTVRDDLIRHAAESRLSDDVAMVAVQRTLS